jgi:hypothetical protein
MVFSPDELNSISNYATADVKDFPNKPDSQKVTARNAVITEKMYLIDQAYYDFETRLTHDDQFVDALGSLASFSTSTVAASIPLAAATKTLSAISAGITAGTGFYQ